MSKEKDCVCGTGCGSRHHLPQTSPATIMRLTGVYGSNPKAPEKHDISEAGLASLGNVLEGNKQGGWEN